VRDVLHHTDPETPILTFSVLSQADSKAATGPVGLVAIAVVASLLAWWFARGLSWREPRFYSEAQAWGGFVTCAAAAIVAVVLATIDVPR
jgi:predicted permease